MPDICWKSKTRMSASSDWGQSARLMADFGSSGENVGMVGESGWESVTACHFEYGAPPRSYLIRRDQLLWQSHRP
jgi:hypothetical protein